MLNKNKWIHGEIDKWLSVNIITEDSAADIRKLYELKNSTNILLIMFSIIGSLLVGTGIILISAKNWYYMSVWIRCAIAFFPLIVAQALSVYVLLRRMQSVPWREGVSLFLTLTIFTTIALIGQIFHLPGDFGLYVLTCGLLSLPIIYILNSTSPTVIYMWTVLNWYALSDGFYDIWSYDKYWFGALILLITPFIFYKIKNDKTGARGQVLAWLAAISGFLATVFVSFPLERAGGPLMAVPFAIYFVLIYLFDAVFYEDMPSYVLRPFKVIGWFGSIVILLVFSYSALWEHYIISKNITLTALAPYIASAAVQILAIILMLKKMKKEKVELSIAFSGLLLSIMLLLAGMVNIYDYIPAVIINICILAIGVLIILKGVGETSLGYTNIGMVLICLLVVLRFFDWEMNLLQRGIAFILIGIGFLAVNLHLVKKRRVVAEI